MLDQTPLWFQYVFLAQTAFLVTLMILWIINRIHARRERAGALADELQEWGLTKLAGPIREYSQGDYSEAIEGFVALAREMKTGGAVALLESAAKKIMEYYAANNATKAQEMIAILQGGAAIKNTKTA